MSRAQETNLLEVDESVKELARGDLFQRANECAKVLAMQIPYFVIPCNFEIPCFVIRRAATQVRVLRRDSLRTL